MEAKRRKSFEHQIEMQKELQSKEKATCYDCGGEIYFNECSDLFY